MKNLIKFAIVGALALGGVSAMAAGAVPADITTALDNTTATFTAITAVATVVAVVLLGFRLLRKSVK